ncbi:MAG: ATP-binding protein [Saprospiraceae bacterium]
MVDHRIGLVSATLAFLWFCCIFNLNGQSSRNAEAAKERELARAEAMLSSFKNDSAIALAGKLLADLERLGQLDAPLGIRAQLVEAMAYEQDQQGEVAISKLLKLIERSKEKKLCDVQAKAHLILALLYEKIGLEEISLKQLQETKACIDRCALDSIYPNFAVRMSSWQRIYGDKDSSLYFAREALRTAPLFRLELEEAIGHMLMNMLLPGAAVDERLRHSLAAVRLYEKLEDYTGCSYMYGAVADIHFQKRNLRLALTYNDSTITVAHLAIAKGHEKHVTIGSIYRFRSELYKNMGEMDSAFHYLHKGYQTELNLVREDNKSKIIEIDSRYNNEKKQQRLDEQQLELTLKKNQLFYTLIIFMLVCLLALGLFFGMRKQRLSNRKLVAQNVLIRKQSERMKSLDVAKSRFFANVSHELRTPLTLLLGPIHTLLKDGQLTGKQARLLQMARQSSKQLEQLVNDILDLRKLEQGHLELYPKPTELPSFVRTYCAQFESLAERKKIDFSVKLPPEDTPAILLDQEKFRQILFNLLANAFKFTPNGGRIETAVSVESGMLHLRVADTGPGIHPDDLPHLFDRYFQTTRPDKPAEGGTGIGLALCQEYAQLFGGTIEVESTLGNGSVFRVEFPVAPAEVGAPATPDLAEDHLVLPIGGGTSRPMPPPSESSGKVKPTILVVEDNLALQDYIRSILQEKYQVVTADHGQAALDLMMNDELRMMNTKQDATNSSFIIHHSSLF